MKKIDSCKRGVRRWGLLERSGEIHQRTYMRDSWTWTTVWGLSDGGRGLGDGHRGKFGTTIIA